jgi:flagellar basal body rod protein FlgG
MDYGLYISASGALNAAYRQDLLTGNLANASTIGFKPDFAAVRQREPVRVEDTLPAMPSNDLLEQLSAGVLSDQTRINLQQGTIKTTGNDLDLAIQGTGFFVLLDEQDKSQNRLRLSRDGRFTIGPDRTLISVSSGMPVMGTNGRPVKITGDGPLTIQGDGTIIQNNEPIATLDVTQVGNLRDLKKAGKGLFIANQVQMSGRKPASGIVVQHALEESAVNEIAVLMDMQSAARAAQTNLGMIRYHDRVMEMAINRLSRVV